MIIQEQRYIWLNKWNSNLANNLFAQILETSSADWSTTCVALHTLGDYSCWVSWRRQFVSLRLLRGSRFRNEMARSWFLQSRWSHLRSGLLAHLRCTCQVRIQSFWASLEVLCCLEIVQLLALLSPHVIIVEGRGLVTHRRNPVPRFRLLLHEAGRVHLSKATA